MAQDNQNRDPQDNRRRQQGQSTDETGVSRGSRKLDDTDEMEDEDEDDRDEDWREPGSPNRRINIG